jgi:hypothetical protein
MLLKIIHGPKKDEVMGGWRKLQNEELHNLRWAGHVAGTEKRNSYRL